MIALHSSAAVLVALLLCANPPLGGASTPAEQAIAKPVASPFAVAIDRETAKLPAWRSVADALVAKHGGSAKVSIIEFDAADPSSLVDPLRTIGPESTAIVVRPDRAGRGFVGALHRALRTLDADPHADTRWGIVTARTPEGARALAMHATPLVARTAFGTADFPMQLFRESIWWSEEDAWRFTMHERDAKHEVRSRPLDETNIAQAVADAINRAPIDLVMTGGHATERGLELGFRKPCGSLRPKDGEIVVESKDGATLPVTHESPKAWIGVGNCLIGNVDGPDSMATTLIERFGVRAHVGYVVVTWYGRGGWGTLKRFTEPAGERTLNQAWADNNAAIIDALLKDFPTLAGEPLASITFDGWLEDDPDRFARAVQARYGDRVQGDAMRELIGLLWDRDAVSYLGDPTWDVRVGRTAPE
jgi:zinc protease